MAVAEPAQNGKTEWVKASAFLIGTSIYKPELYHQIGQGKATPTEVETYIKGLPYGKSGFDSPERYFLFLAMSFLLRNTDDGEEMREIALICLNFEGEVFPGAMEEDQAIAGMLRDLRRDIDDRMHIYKQSTFQQLYSMIEDWRPFIE